MRSPFYFLAQDAKLMTAGTALKQDGEPMVIGGMGEQFMQEDFLAGATAGNTGISPVTANNGTVTVTTADADAPGIIRLTTVTSSNAQAAVRLGVSTLLLGGGVLTYSWRVRVSALSITADEYSLRAGLGDSTTGEPTDGVYFCYDHLTDGDFWSIKTASNTSVTKKVMDGTSGNPTQAVLANTWYRLTATVNAAASSVSYWINGTLMGTITTNIPSGAGRQTAPFFAVVRSAGSTSLTHDADYYWQYMKLTTAR
jgi:hypothetical protein